KFINFTVVKFSVFLVLGILASHFFPVSILLFNIVLFLFGAVILLWLWARNQLFQTIYFGIATYLCIFAMGYFSYQIRLPRFQPNHYSEFISENSSDVIQLKIIQNSKPDKFNFKYFAKIQSVNGKSSSGKILLNVSKGSMPKTFSSD